MLQLFRSFRYWLLAVFVLLLVIVAFIFFAKPADFLAKRVSDLIYYLVMQKRYVFDKYTDPNVYPKLPDTKELDKALVALNASTSTTNISENIKTTQPISISTTTISEINLPIATSSMVKIGQLATSVPGLIIKDPNVVLAPLPDPILISSPTRPGTPTAILEYTNNERAKSALKPLISNATLDKIATERLEDLFTNQYFDHESPDGKGVPALAQKNGYSYLLIGENLALGNFAGDLGIVKAWMDSPGHRANILNPKYQELGVAERVGDFKGDQVTIAVQTFGQPAAVCRKPNSKAKAVITENTAIVDHAQTEADNIYQILVSLKDNPDLDRSYYDQKVQEYNYFAKNVNKAIAALKKMSEAYILQTNQYNSCISQS
jgi:uncharacterized protein YkwD